MADLTIDLAELGVRKTGPHMLPATDIDPLGSEDEGPPDFTLNLEKWMRGTEKWKKEGGRVEDDRENEEDQHSGGNYSEGDEMADEEKGMEDLEEESEFMPLSTSTPAPHVLPRGNVPGSRHTLDERSLANRPSSRLNTDATKTTTAEEVSDQISALQAKIEQMQTEGGNHQLIKESLQTENSTLRDEIDGLRDELSNMRSTVSKMRQQAKATDKERESDRKSQEEARSKANSLQDKFEPLLQELAIARSTAEAEQRHSEAKIVALEAKLLSSQESLMRQQLDSRYAQEAKSSENLKLKSELDICKGEAKAYQQTLQTREEDHMAAVAVLQRKLDAVHETQSRADVLKMELDHALEQLTETRRIVDTVEDENDRLTQEIERQRDELNETTAVVGSKDASIAAANATIEDLRDEISRIKGEKNIGLIEEDVHDAALERLRHEHQANMQTALEQLRHEHQANMQTAQTIHEQQRKELQATILRAHNVIRKGESRLQKRREQITSLNEEITTLKSRLKAPVEPPAATIAEHRNAIRMLSAKLNAANETILTTRHTLAAAHKSLAVSTNENDRLNKHFDAFKVAVKKHYRGVLQKQDLAWKTKMDAILEERKQIVKMLFIMWGREEMGIAPEGEKQPYRYKFFKKNGERIPQPGETDKNGERIPLPGEKEMKGERIPLPGEKEKKDKKNERNPLAAAEKDNKEERILHIREKDKKAERNLQAAAVEKDQKINHNSQPPPPPPSSLPAAQMNEARIRKVALAEKQKRKERIAQIAANIRKHEPCPPIAEIKLPNNGDWIRVMAERERERRREKV